MFKFILTYACSSYRQERLYMYEGFVIVSTNPTSWTGRKLVMFSDKETVMKDSDGRPMLSYGNHYLNSSKDRLYYHLAVIEDYVASCFTFTSPSRVPAGKHHHVSMPYNCDIENIMKINQYKSTVTNTYINISFLQPGMYLNGEDSGGFEVFVHNNRQV